MVLNDFKRSKTSGSSCVGGQLKSDRKIQNFQNFVKN
jgi:hypothetical protein